MTAEEEGGGLVKEKVNMNWQTDSMTKPMLSREILDKNILKKKVEAKSSFKIQNT